MMITSTMMLELVSDGKYWIDVLHNKVISLLKGISTLTGRVHSIPTCSRRRHCCQHKNHETQ
jgi:hypothetical protein